MLLQELPLLLQQVLHHLLLQRPLDGGEDRRTQGKVEEEEHEEAEEPPIAPLEVVPAPAASGIVERGGFGLVVVASYRGETGGL